MEEHIDLMERMEFQKRPTLTDPKEFALIRSIHFEHDALPESKADRQECFERQKVNRNQSR